MKITIITVPMICVALKNMKKSKCNITFPNLMMIPFLSALGIIIKLFCDTKYDWIDVIMINPVLIYFGWCIGYCVLAYLSVKIINMINKEN